MNSLSLYIHFPFCIQKCRYCDFYSIPADPKKISGYTLALKKEIEFSAKKHQNQSVISMYIGGGSPNLWPPNEIMWITELIHDSFNVSDDFEFTVEMNPVRCGPELASGLVKMGVNRINIGAQSFNNRELELLGRTHSGNDTILAADTMKSAGIDHIGLDLIYGIPGQTLPTWQHSLQRALDLGPDHLSLYNLSYEHETPLYKMRKRGRIEVLDVDLEREMYRAACDCLAKGNYRHYEISNWARPGSESCHNQVYWNGGNYLGLGPSAHSFDGSSRWWNLRSVEDYIERMTRQLSVYEQREVLTEEDLEIEQLFLRLRTDEGISRGRFENLFHIDFQRIINQLDEENLNEEYWIFDGDRFKLTPAGWFVSDAIIYTLLTIVEELRNGH